LVLAKHEDKYVASSRVTLPKVGPLPELVPVQVLALLVVADSSSFLAQLNRTNDRIIIGMKYFILSSIAID